MIRSRTAWRWWNICKNIAILECVAHHERLNNTWVWLKYFTKNFAKNPRQLVKQVLLSHLQMQCSELFWKKRSFWKSRKIHRKSPVLESLLNKFTALLPEILLKKRLRHRCFPANFAKFSRTFSLHHCLVFHYFKRNLSLCISFYYFTF